MTLPDFMRARLVEFAVREAGERAPVEAMRAICIVMKNRAKAGWYEGNMLRVIEHADEVAAHEPGTVKLDPDKRTFQLILHQIDDIYYGQGGWGEEGLSMEASLTEKKHEKLYWMKMGKDAPPVRPWFRENILEDRINHKKQTQLGLMMFIE